jgi:ribosomal protein L37AE/L43A
MIEKLNTLDNKMAYCPCCSDILLRHVRSRKTYLYCRRCRLEILEAGYGQQLGYKKVSMEALLDKTNRQTSTKDEKLVSPTLPK